MAEQGIVTRRAGEPRSRQLAGDRGLADVDVAGLPEGRHSGRSDAPGGHRELASKLRNAADWLRDLLERGPLDSKEIELQASAGELGWRTVQRAKVQAGVVITREGFGRGARYVWMLASARAKPEASCMPSPRVPTEPPATCVPTEPSVPAAPFVSPEPCAPSPQLGRHDERTRAALSEDQREAFEERAGIMQFDGGLSRDDAEAETWRLIGASGRKAQAAT